ALVHRDRLEVAVVARDLVRARRRMERELIDVQSVLVEGLDPDEHLLEWVFPLEVERVADEIVGMQRLDPPTLHDGARFDGRERERRAMDRTVSDLDQGLVREALAIER